jgi:hypothetical protein
MKDTFKQILEDGFKKGYNPRETVEAVEWFRKKASKTRTLRNTKTSKIIRLGEDRGSNRNTFNKKQMIGRMYLFEYDPKTKNTPKLPYYDRFPLVFPIEKYSDSFLGMNMHYLYPAHRAVLMDALTGLTLEAGTPERTRLKMTYNLLNKSAKYKYFKPCVKRYITENVMTDYMKIEPDEWDIALFLPLERFKGASRRKVWAESRRRYK